MKIAVDGPAGAGKSTVAKHIAKKNNLVYIDSGAMYRAVAYKAIKEGIDIYDTALLLDMLSRTDVDFDDGRILLGGYDISDKIRTPEVSKMASDISALAPVREKLVGIQREMGKTRDVIMDGRDIGTNVFPDAKYKFFITATARERAKRRQKELLEKGISTDLDEVTADIQKRDHNDSTRELNPLKKADDAIEIDTTGKSVDQVVGEVAAYIDSR